MILLSRRCTSRHTLSYRVFGPSVSDREQIGLPFTSPSVQQDPNRTLICGTAIIEMPLTFLETRADFAGLAVRALVFVPFSYLI